MIIRKATARDIVQMADLLDAIIVAGGTTAITGNMPPERLSAWMASYADHNAWHVAEEDGVIMGFQWIEPNPDIPDAAEIATFVRIGATGSGIGAMLFDATRRAAHALGFKWINAAIRSDNESGLRYYARMGFIDWNSDPSATLSTGVITGKTFKRFDL